MSGRTANLSVNRGCAETSSIYRLRLNRYIWRTSQWDLTTAVDVCGAECRRRPIHLSQITRLESRVTVTPTTSEGEFVDGDLLGDIKPQTPIRTLDRSAFESCESQFPVEVVAPVVGMQPAFIKKVLGSSKPLSAGDVLTLLDQDCFSETLVPRSMVLDQLLARITDRAVPAERRAESLELPGGGYELQQGHAVARLSNLPSKSVQTVVTSTPYWGMRIYKDTYVTSWLDSEVAAYGHEQTPEGFLRHTMEALEAVAEVLTDDGSIWWNVMDTFNTRTQIRGNAREALNAMQGNDDRSWGDHDARRYSAGHSFLLDGEQCLIPSRIAERASRMGLYVKSIITWSKTSTLPEPQTSRVSRSLEYILHITKNRTPKFHKDAYRQVPTDLGGRDPRHETDKLSDVWRFGTSAGRDGHGAQFPVSLPGRCIAISSDPGDVVLDPFVGSGNSGVAALRLGRRFVGIDVSEEYLEIAKQRMEQTYEQIPLGLRDVT